MTSQERVAVVVVHGVADQPAGGSVRAIARLLAGTCDSQSRPVYGTFRESPLHIRVEPVVAANTVPAGRMPPGVDETFMWDLLRDHVPEGKDTVYTSLRLESDRTDERTVHLYELYWADLSRLGSGFLRVFTELYQILLHLGRLGYRTVKAARAAVQAQAASHPASSPAPAVAGPAIAPWAWYGFEISVRLATNILALPIALLNLLLLLPAIVAVSTNLSLTVQYVVGGLLPGLFLAFFLAFGLLPHISRLKFLVWLLSPIAVVAAVILTKTSLDHWGVSWANIFALEVLVAVGGVLCHVVRRYERHRPHARLWAACLGLPTVVYLAARLFFGPEASGNVEAEQARVFRAAFDAVGLLYIALEIMWIFFIVALWSALATGWWVTRVTPDERIRRVARTARLTLAVPAVVFLLLTTLLWQTANVTLASRIPMAFYDGGPLRGRIPGVLLPCFVDRLISMSLAPWGSAFLLVVLLAGIGVIWGLGVIVWFEVKPKGQRYTSDDVGRWLDHAGRALRWAGEMIVFAIAVVLPVGVLSTRSGLTVWLFELVGKAGTRGAVLQGLLSEAGAAESIRMAAAAIAASGVGLLVLRKRLEWLSGGFRVPVDVLLDVDSYLRDRPRLQSSRARIMARYASLLRHLTVEGYERIVIVAHSQGTVLTADLLRFGQQLHAGAPPAAADGVRRPAMLFFSMGSPLRQLYGYLFPHLYGWTQAAGTQPGAVAPHPAELGLCVWINAFRSGDYVGRALWTSDAAPAPRLILSPQGDIEYGDVCLGPGAHTHYWDETASSPAGSRAAETVTGVLEHLISMPLPRRCVPGVPTAGAPPALPASGADPGSRS